MCGICDECTWKKLLVINKLTLAWAIEITQKEEAVNKNAEALKAKETTENEFTNPCYRCGDTSHEQTECRFRNADCHNCGKRGHIASVCKSRRMLNISRDRKRSSAACKPMASG